jgi:branched-chain amino acid transport system permease protein
LTIDATALAHALVTGLAQGAMIALVALGYTMVYGVLRLINFAHGDVFMLGAYAALFGMLMVGGEAHPIWAGAFGTVFAMAVASVVGVLVERVAYRPLRRAAAGGARGIGKMAPLVTALAASVLLQNVAQLLFSARFRSYPRLFSQTRMAIFVVSIAVMLALQWVVRRTWFGKGLRALAENEEAARLMGVRASRTVALTFALGSALAAVGAVLYCLDQSEVYPTMGVAVGTRAFVAAVLGGIGSIPGAMLGGLLLGVLGECVKLTDYSGGVDVLVFIVLIFVLLLRPSGLIGQLNADRA